ncbi:hypothetical protein ACFL21_00545 [Patescibacteria group bacterium]
MEEANVKKSKTKRLVVLLVVLVLVLGAVAYFSLAGDGGLFKGQLLLRDACEGSGCDF